MFIYIYTYVYIYICMHVCAHDCTVWCVWVGVCVCVCVCVLNSALWPLSSCASQSSDKVPMKIICRRASLAWERLRTRSSHDWECLVSNLDSPTEHCREFFLGLASLQTASCCYKSWCESEVRLVEFRVSKCHMYSCVSFLSLLFWRVLLFQILRKIAVSPALIPWFRVRPNSVLQGHSGTFIPGHGNRQIETAVCNLAGFLLFRSFLLRIKDSFA